MNTLNSLKIFIGVLIILILSALAFDATPARAQQTGTDDKTYDSGAPVPFRQVTIIGQNFTAIPVGDASVTFCCDGCGSSPDAPSGSAGVLCTGCTGGGGPVSCPSNTIRVTCQDSMEGCPVE
jgi:hypothetical protein